MRAFTLLAILVCALVAACSKEPSFDERFDEQSSRLDATANRMQQDLTRQIEAAAAAQPNGAGPAIGNRAMSDE